MLQFLVELIEHPEEDNANGDPLGVVDVVPKDEDAQDHAEDLTSGRHQGKDVLLEIGNDVVDTDLSNHLQSRDSSNVDQGLRIVPNKGKGLSQGTITKGLVANTENKTVSVGTGEQMVGCRFEMGLAVGLSI